MRLVPITNDRVRTLYTDASGYEWEQGMSITIKKIRSRNERLRSKKQMAHKPTLVGQGKWHSRTSLWAYKRLSRRKRLIAKASRRLNRMRAA